MPLRKWSKGLPTQRDKQTLDVSRHTFTMPGLSVLFLTDLLAAQPWLTAERDGDVMEPCAGSFSIAYNNGGPVSLIWGWFWVAIMTMSVVRTKLSILPTIVYLCKIFAGRGLLGLLCPSCLSRAACRLTAWLHTVRTGDHNDAYACAGHCNG